MRTKVTDSPFSPPRTYRHLITIGRGGGGVALARNWLRGSISRRNQGGIRVYNICGGRILDDLGVWDLGLDFGTR